MAKPWSLVVALMFLTSTAWADTESLGASLSGSAKTDYESARSLFADSDFGGALVKFQSALDASHDERLRWNIAACERGLRHYAAATRALEQYRTAAAIDAKDRSDADDLVAAFRPYVAALTVHANVEASVLLDEKPVGSTPIDHWLVDLGEHTVVLKKSGFVDLARPLSITGNAEVLLELSLVPIAHRGRLAVQADPGALITLDGKSVGVGTYEATVASGTHDLRVSASGKKPQTSRVLVVDGELRSVDVHLEDSPSILPLWAWIGIGALLVTTGTIVTIIAVQPSDKRQPVLGTIPPRLLELSFGR